MTSLGVAKANQARCTATIVVDYDYGVCSDRQHDVGQPTLPDPITARWLLYPPGLGHNSRAQISRHHEPHTSAEKQLARHSVLSARVAQRKPGMRLLQSVLRHKVQHVGTKGMMMMMMMYKYSGETSLLVSWS